MKSLIFPALGWTTIAACTAAPVSTTSEGGLVEASPTTQTELGVSHWSTKDAPAAIEGYDDSGAIVISLRHVVKSAEGRTLHAFVLREHDHEAVTAFSVEHTAEGLDTFRVLRDDATDPVVERVLSRMKRDLSAEAAPLAGGDLHLTDIPWNEPSVHLVCGDAKSELLQGADTCMSHKSASSQEAKSWALACSDYLAQHPGTSRDAIACKQDGVNPCTCVDRSGSGLGVEYQNGVKMICGWEFDGVGKYEPAQNCSDPSKVCPKQTYKCVTQKEWCNKQSKPDDC